MSASASQAAVATELQTHPLDTESFVQHVQNAQATVPEVMDVGAGIVAAMLPPSTSEAVRRTSPLEATQPLKSTSDWGLARCG
jgi:hypothetical protein